MDFFCLDSGGPGDDVVDLVPGEPFIAGDVERLADGGGVGHESDEAFGEIGMVGEGPEAGSVAVDDDRLAFEHSVEDGVSVVEREEGFVVGVRRAHDGHGEFFVAVCLEQGFFTSDFVARVFPEGVVEGGGFSDGQACGRGLVGAGAADEDVLVGFASEELDVAFDLAGNEVDPVDNDVPLSVSEELLGFFEVVDVAVDDFDAFGGWSGGFSSVEEGEFEALLHGEGGAGGANDPGSADEEGFHGITLPGGRLSFAVFGVRARPSRDRSRRIGARSDSSLQARTSRMCDLCSEHRRLGQVAT